MNEITKLKRRIAELEIENKKYKRELDRFRLDMTMLSKLTDQATLLKNFNEEEKEKQNFYNDLMLTHSSGKFILFDENFRLLMTTHHGEVRYKFLGDVFEATMDGSWIDRLKNKCSYAIERHEMVSFTDRIRFSEDEKAEVYNVNITPVENEMTESVCGVMVFNEITEVVEAKERAEAASRAKSNFLANISHEIRTPMNAIVGMTEMIIRDTKDKKILKYAYDIKSAGTTLLSIIKDLLDLQKIESGTMETDCVDYEFASIVNDIMNMTSKKARDKGLEFCLQTSRDIPRRMRGDDVKIKQVVTNLVNNAIKFTESGKVTVSIGFDREKNELRIDVIDTGVGITPEEQKKIFKSFMRLEESKNRSIEGMGLGLNISKQLLALMNGRIEFESEYGKGSTFTMYVPQTVLDEKPMQSFLEETAYKPMSSGTFDMSFTAPEASILIVDDNVLNIEVITAMLEQTQLRVTTATSGQECLDTLKTHRFDLIFLDQMMPGMSGVDTLRSIRNRKLAEGTPVIAFTADAVAGAKESYLKEGFAGYLPKPIVCTELERIILEFLPKRYVKAAGENSELAGKTPSVIVVDPTSENFNRLKIAFTNQLDAVFVKDMDSAYRYLEKNNCDYIMNRR